MREISNGGPEDSLAADEGFWEGLRGARIFMTGGTGFFGCRLLESFLHANQKLELKAETLVLTRDEAAFRGRCPQLAGAQAVSFHRGDVRSFDFPQGQYSHIIHAATEASDKLNQDQPDLMLETIVQGTRHTLEFTKSCGAQKFLFISSGAIYGKQPDAMTHIPEDHVAVFDPAAPTSAYTQGKRQAELLCVAEADRGKMETTIARGFAFVGPGLSLDTHFAIGNFIRDSLQGRPIEVRGDGTPYRSYLYTSDLATWLWTILLRGRSGRAYNVGSENRVSIRELAETVARVLKPDLPVRVLGVPCPGRPAEQYVPSTRRAREELGLRQTVGLEEAIRRTAAWAAQAHKSQSCSWPATR